MAFNEKIFLQSQWREGITNEESCGTYITTAIIALFAIFKCFAFLRFILFVTFYLPGKLEKQKCL